MRRRDVLLSGAASVLGSEAVAQSLGLRVPGAPSLGLSQGLSVPILPGLSWLSGTPTVLGDITAASTGTGYTTSGVSYPTNGWVVRIPTSLGAVTSCDPTKVTLTVTDYGWATDGSATSWSRTVTGTARVFKSYPDGATYTDADQAAGTVEIGLDQQLYNSSVTDSTSRVYQSVVNAINFASGFMTGASGSSTVGSYTGSVTRSDSKDYPLPIWKHVDHLQQLMDGSTLTIEWAAVHAFAQKGQQLACLEAWARMAGTDGTVARASSMTDSRWTSDGAVPLGAPAAMHVPVYSTVISGTGLADGIGSIRSRAKPWIGPAINSYDTINGVVIGDTAASLGGSSDGTSFNLMADMPFVKDNLGTGKYTRIYAYVNQDGTGLTSSSLTGLSTSSADPGSSLSYQTFSDAMGAMSTYNQSTSAPPLGRGTGKTHVDNDGLVIMLRDVAGSTLGSNAGAYSIYKATTFGALFTGVNLPIEVRAASGTRSALCRMRPIKFDGSAITNTTKDLASKIKFVNITFDSQGVTAGSGVIVNSYTPVGWSATTAPTVNTSAYTIFQDCDFVGNGDALCWGVIDYSYRTRFTDTQLPVGFSNWQGQAVTIGCSYFGTSQPDMTCNLACYTSNVVPATYSTVLGGPQPRQTIVFNSRWDCNGASGITIKKTSAGIGLGIVGSVLRNYGSITSRFIYLYGDLDITPASNLVFQNVSTPLMSNVGAGPSSTPSSIATFTGTRWNMLYNDTGWVGIPKEASFKFNAFAHTAMKDSYFGGDTSQKPSADSAAAWSSGTAYSLGNIVWDPATGSNTVSTSNIYQAKQAVPAGTALSNTAYWYNAGIQGNVQIGPTAGRTGNKRVRMGVNCYGNVNAGSVQGGASDHTPGESTNSWLSDTVWPGSGTKWGNADATTYYVLDECAQAVPNGSFFGDPGTGDYRPAVSSPLRSMIPANMHVMPFDYLGTALKGDGTDAAGALQP